VKTSLAAVLAAVVLVGAGCGGRTAATPVVVDTDMSTDDIVALLYAASSPKLDLKAVTVSGTGLTTCPAGARHALQLLAVAGRADVPVACGRAEPLAGANQFPVEWRSRADAFFGLELPPVARKARGTATDLLAGVIGHTKHVTLLSLAPLTDTADLLRAHPALGRRLTRIVAMGGALDVPGNVGSGHERAEYNVWIDPVAAQRVLASDVPVTIVPLDATNDVPVTVFFSEALRRYHYATPAATAAWELFQQTPAVWTGGQYFWDPLAAAAVTRPQFLGYARQRVRVDVSSGRLAASPAGPAVDVATSAQRPAFERELLRTLLGGAPFAIAQNVARPALVFDGASCRYQGPAAGQAGTVTFDTVDRSAIAFAYRVVDRSNGLPGTTELRGETPPHGRLTWVGFLSPGTKSISCSAGSHTTLAGTITLAGAR
jgi:inosine-uridine nucleoside N-ribohydrolase